MKTKFTTKFENRNSNHQNEALVVSFFGGKDYYTEKALRLAERLQQLDVAYDICEFQLEGEMTWPSICKAKIAFYHEMLMKHQRPIMWIDVDSQVISRPSFLDMGGADFGGFLRNFKDLREYNPYQFSRLFHPGYLLFNYTKMGRAFVEHLRTVSEDSSNLDVTDDYVLQESIATFPDGLNTLVLSSSLLQHSQRKASEYTSSVFIHGDSGHVQQYRSTVVQHEKPILPSYLVALQIDLMCVKLLKQGKVDQCLSLLVGAQHIHESLPALHGRLLKLLKKKKLKQELSDARSRGKKNEKLFKETLLFELNSYSGSELQVCIEQGLKIASRLKDQASLDLLASRQFRMDLDSRAKELGFSDKQRAHVWWWEKPFPGNLGDILNPYIIEKLSGIPPKFSTKGPRILACGSLIARTKPETTVWGTGSPRANAEVSSAAKYLAVRGPLTREIIVKAGGNCPEVYGDPALLLPRIYTPKPRERAESLPPYGLILHHNHSIDSLNVNSCEVEDISIIRLGYDQIEEFLDEIASKKCIFSTSLHGIIIAHAYGVPAVWCSLAGQKSDVPGDGMKFHDYLNTVGVFDASPVELSDVSCIDGALAEHAIVAEKMPDLDRLLSVAPFSTSVSRGQLAPGSSCFKFLKRLVGSNVNRMK
jgi:hypothetical protein